MLQDYTIPTILFAVSLAVFGNEPRLPFERASVQRVTPQYFFLCTIFKLSKKWKN